MNKKISLNTFAIYKGVFVRFLQFYKHVLGLILGGFIASVKGLPPYRKKGLRSAGKRMLAFFLSPFVKRKIRTQPFHIQLRIRLELLGPTYIKLGQIMAVREDLFPRTITDELKKLLDHLPEVPFEVMKGIIEESLGAPLNELFFEIDEKSIGSASIGQSHRAITKRGKPVVLKIIKPGIRDTMLSDLKLLQISAKFLELIIPRYQPKIIIDEFCRYTEKEIDLRFEADHAEIFAANFSGKSEIVFPKIYRELSTSDVLCMEYFEGIKPTEDDVFKLSKSVQDNIIDLGAEAIIKMLYDDGFFHADLHAGNIIILPGPKIGFIDLGMVGRFDEKMKRDMLYYFYSLVTGDVEGSTKYLLAMARIGEGSDPVGFKRSAADLFRRYLTRAVEGNLSLAEIIIESISISSRYRVFFPVEMMLMVKALVTFEGVGRHINPKLDIPAISKKHITHIYINRYSPKKIVNHIIRGIPPLLDVVFQLPEILSDSSRLWDNTINDTKPKNQLPGIKSSIIAGACIIGGAIAFVQGAEPAFWIIMFSVGLLLALFGK